MSWENDIIQPNAPQPWERDLLATQPTQARPASGAMEAIKAGYQGSATGLALRGKMPELVMDPENSKWWERALAGGSQVVNELPFMVVGALAGGLAGGAAGTAVAPGPGTAIGTILATGAGMFAVPGVVRESLIQAYKSGEIKTVGEFMAILKEVAKTGGKEAVVGAVTMGAGAVAARVVGRAVAPAIGESITVQTGTRAIGTADVVGQIAGMTTVPAAFEGRLPHLQDIIDAAVVVGGLKTAHVAATRIGEVYRRTGKTPVEVVADAKRDPEIAEDLSAPKPEPATVVEFAPAEIARSEASLKAIYDDVRKQMRDAGRQEDEAVAIAILERERYRARGDRLRIDPAVLYREAGLQIRGGDEPPITTPQIPETPPPGAPRFTPPPEEMFRPEPPPPRMAVIGGLETREVPLANLTLSKEVPQFKAQADEQGVIVPLGGKFDRTGVGPIQVWERLDGTMEVISGRHRFDLAKRTGETTIPAQVHREAEGFTAREAANLDAKLNIREEQGSVADYASYFKETGYAEEAARAEGLLARAKGKAGFQIARDASPDLLASHRAGLVSDDAAVGISRAAPGDAALQALGIKLVNEGKSTLLAVNTMKATGLMARERGVEQGDIFGFDDSAMREAADMASKASRQQRAISEQISAVSGAARRPEVARRMGVDVRDPEAVKAKIAELKQEQSLWDNWTTHPELIAKLREQELKQEGRPALDLKGETEAEIKVREKELAEQIQRQRDEEARIARQEARRKRVTVDQADLFNEQRTLFQERRPIFYSELARQVEGLKQESATVDQWKATIKNLKGVKREEREWSGLDEWLDIQQGKVTKQQIAEFLGENGVRVDEKVLGADTRGLVSEQQLRSAERAVVDQGLLEHFTNRGARDYALDAARGELSEGQVRNMSDAMRPLVDELRWSYTHRTDQVNPTKFSQWQLPGGENYREMLITLPVKQNEAAAARSERAKELIARRAALELQRDNLGPGAERQDLIRQIGNTQTQLDMVMREREDASAFRSSHFDQPNVLAHIRFNERTDAEGKRVLFVEEFQSDWAQKGKREGFAGEKDDARARIKARLEEIQDRFDEMPVDANERARLADEQRHYTEELARAEAHAARFGSGVPRAPFVGKTESWVALSMKRMIRWAAENGYDRIAWTRGEQQVERYEQALRKAVDVIEWEKTAEGVQIAGYKRNKIGQTGLIDPTRRTKVADTRLKETELTDALGKVMADRIRDDPAQKGTIEGEGLKIDDTGMAAFYDRIVPNVANDVLKKLGGSRVTETTIAVPSAEGRAALRVRLTNGILSDRRFNRQQDADAYANRMGGTVEIVGEASKETQPAFDITPALREKAMEGLSLFQRREQSGEVRGSYSPAENLIRLFTTADKSTAIHELGHSWLEEARFDARRADAPDQIKADWELIRKELGIAESGDISTASHETWARMVERYVAEGKAPSPELQGVFARFREWLLGIYRSLTELNVQISPEMREVMDRMLATEEQISAAREMGIPRAYVDAAKAEQARKIVPGRVAEETARQPFADELPAGPGFAPDTSHVNYKYINTPLDVKLTMQRMAELDQESIQRQRGGTRGVKSWEEANAEQAAYVNDVLGGGPDTLRILSPRDPGAGPDVKLGILRKLMTGAAKDSARLRDVIIEKGPDATMLEQLEYMGSIERARMLQAEFLGERAGVARALNALKDVTEGSGDIGRMLDVIGYGTEQRLFQRAMSPAEQAAEMKARLDEIMLNYKGKTVFDIARLHKEIGTLKGTFKFAKETTRATKWEMVVEGWKASLLSGPVTHVTNLFGTGAFQSLRPVVDALAAGVGMLRGAKVGMGEADRASLQEAVSRFTGMLGGVQDGLKVGYHVFKMDELTGKTESYREAIPGRAGEIIRIPLRLMGAEDAIVSTMYTRGETKALAVRQAFTEGLNPLTREFAERVTHLTDNPTPAMRVAAETEATRMTFNMPLGEKGRTLQLLVNRWHLQWMIPFIRTPINIAKEVARMTPAAPLVGEWRQAMARGGVARDRAIAELALGTGIMTVTMAFAFDEKVSGAGEPDPGKKRAKVGVWQPYSVLIGDTWYEYSRIQPMGTLIGLAADVSNVWDHMTDEEMDKVPKMLSIAFANAVTNQTFLQGVTNMVNAMSDPKRFGPRFAQQFAGTAVPNIVGQTTAMTDPYVREVNSMLEAIQARVPGMRQELLPKRDWLGEPIETKERMGLVSPVRTQEVSTDKVRLEADRLNISVGDAPKKIHVGRGTGKVGDVDITPEQRNKYTEVSGRLAHTILTPIVNSSNWDNLPDLAKRRVYTRVLMGSHKAGAIAAFPPEMRASAIQTITQKLQVELQPGTQ